VNVVLALATIVLAVFAVVQAPATKKSVQVLVEVNGQGSLSNLIVVTIPEGKDKPYTVKEKGVYIRTGSNKRTISRYELDEIYSAKQGIKSLYL
jgi:predicted HTH transcriptional regulator